VRSKFGQEICVKIQRIRSIAASAVMTAALGTAMFVTVPQSYADEHAKCQHNIERAEAKLDEAVRKHGERSHQADQLRRDLNAERERCWNQYHGWWNGHDRQWHTDRDWEDHH
jgi:hypothetical protein